MLKASWDAHTQLLLQIATSAIRLFLVSQNNIYVV